MGKRAATDVAGTQAKVHKSEEAVSGAAAINHVALPSHNTAVAAESAAAEAAAAAAAAATPAQAAMGAGAAGGAVPSDGIGDEDTKMFATLKFEVLHTKLVRPVKPAMEDVIAGRAGSVR